MSTIVSKTPKDSEVVMREIVMPNMTNPHGTIFGGQLVAWMDIAAVMVAEKHSQSPVVTVHIDDVNFINNTKLGCHVKISASLHYVGNTSMVIGVMDESENPYTQEIVLTTKAYLTFVAIDEDGKAKSVPVLTPETKEEIERYQKAKQSVAARKKQRES